MSRSLEHTEYGSVRESLNNERVDNKFDYFPAQRRTAPTP